MAKINYLKGDATLPTQTPAIIAHITNDLGAWGSGFVIALSNRFGQGPKNDYQKWVKSEKSTLGKVLFYTVNQNIIIANLGAQSGLRNRTLNNFRSIIPLQYPSLDTCLNILYKKAAELNVTVHMPRIGCGLAGGTWEDVEPLITKNISVETYVYDF